MHSMLDPTNYVLGSVKALGPRGPGSGDPRGSGLGLRRSRVARPCDEPLPSMAGGQPVASTVEAAEHLESGT